MMDAGSPPDDRHDHPAEEWVEPLVRTVAHLAAQLTLAQIRLRALGTALEAAGTIDSAAVQEEVRVLALAEAGHYLRENLGETLRDLVDVETLERDLIALAAAG